MEAGGAILAGASRTTRLDPFALPVHFPANDAGADGQMRHVELDRDRVVLRRAVRGMRMKIRLPVEAFVGITLVSSDASGNTASVILDHCDPALSVPLLDVTALDDAAATWRAWGRVLGLSLWCRDPDGDVSMVQTGRRTLGSLIGDHVKTAVGTRLMTGSYVGYSSMVATSAIPPTFVPSFTFLTDRGHEDYRPDKAVEVMKAAYARRSRVWHDADESTVRYARTAAAEAER